MIATAPGKGGFRPESRLYRSREHLFRGSLGRFATGVAVVTFDTSTGSVQGTSTGSVQGTSTGSVQAAPHRRGRHGITVNSFTSVSMTPPLVLVSIARTTA
ncbi:MAG TPA: flavin reductase family protein, partial [Homoserinimonas sp.]|nr:flavin reductase family protein [Homoserinimonas sp.]